MRINVNGCCGYYTITDMSCTSRQLDGWLKNSFQRHINNNSDESGGKCYQIIMASYQWSEEKEEILLDFGWRIVSRWKNNSGSICTAYQFTSPTSDRNKSQLVEYISNNYSAEIMRRYT